MRRVVASLVFASALVGVLVAGSTSHAVAQSERLVVVDAATDERQVMLTVVAPPGLRDADVNEASFVVVIGDQQILPTVEHVVGDDLDVVLLVDVSGSMTEAALGAAKASGAAFIRQLPVSTRVAVVSFGDAAAVVQPFTNDLEIAIDQLDALVAGGETALYAAVVEAARQFDPSVDSIRTVVLLSDGGNTVDEGSLGNAQAALMLTEATLHAISIETEEADPAELDALAEASGGTVARVEQIEAIEALYRSIASDLGNQYRLSFVAPGEGETTALIRARNNTGVVAEATLALSLPVASGAGEATKPVVPEPSPMVAAPNPGPRGVVDATAPVSVSIEASDNQLLKWGGIGATAIGAAIICFLVIVPGERGKNVRPIQQFSPSTKADTTRGVRWFVDGLTGTAERVLSGRRIGTWLSTVLDTAGWKIRNTEFVVLVGLVTIVAFFAGAISSFGLGLSLATMVLLGVVLVLMLLVNRRRDAFNEQLNGTLQMMAGGLRTGYSLAQVMALVAEEAEEPTNEEFSRIVVETRLGRDLIESALGVAERMKSEDFAWATAAMEISRDVGGDLAEVLDNVASTIRTRASVRRQILALSAEGRVSAAILVALPFPIFFWQLLVNRDYTLLLFNNGLGRAIFSSAVAALFIGAFWMRRMIQVEY